VEPVEQLEFFEASDQYSQELPLTEINILENPQLFIECYFVQNNRIFLEQSHFFCLKYLILPTLGLCPKNAVIY
jgi:hypothetical protein